jgi:hypothetical protein
MRNVHHDTARLWSAVGVGVAFALLYLWLPIVFSASLPLP